MFKSYAFIFVLAIFLGGCTSSTVSDGESPSESRAMTLYNDLPDRYKIPGLVAMPRVNVFDINGWSAIDSQSLTISAGASKRYLVVLQVPTTDLKYANVIAWRRGDSVIRPGFDRIYIGGNSIPVPYQIQAIFELDGRKGAREARDYILSYQAPLDSVD